MYTETQTLIVVCNDELLLNQLRKRVETNDDDQRINQIVGTKDGTVAIVAWDEKMWLEQKKTGDISGKLLFIGKVKGTENLLPLIDIKFQKYGVKYGWSGNQAIIYADSKELKKKENYTKFLAELSGGVSEELTKKKKKVGWNVRTVAKGAGFLFAPWLAGLAIGGWLLKDVHDDAVMVSRQQYIYGINHLYEHHLNEFLKA